MVGGMLRMESNTSFNNLIETQHVRQMPKDMSLIAGYYMIFVSALGIVENGLVLNTFRRHPKLRFISSNLVQVLSVYDLAMAVCALPFIFSSCIANRWLFSEIGCQWYGFCMTAIGLGSISSLTCIAVERYVIITGLKHETAERAEARMKKVAFGCVFFGVLLGLLPFFGVGSYAHEPVFLSCAPAWWSKEKRDIVFVVILFTFAFVIPVFLIMFSYAGICFKVCAIRTRTRRKNRYIKLAIVSFLMIACFLLSWGPYAVFAFLQAFKPGFSISAIENMLPVMMAKSCILWNPLIYVGGNVQFRQMLKHDLSDMLKSIVNKIKIDNNTMEKTRIEDRNKEELKKEFLPGSSMGCIRKVDIWVPKSIMSQKYTTENATVEKVTFFQVETSV